MTSLCLGISVAVARPSGGQLREAQRAVERGQRALQSGRYEDAISYYKKAQRLVPDTKNLLKIALIYSRWEGHCQEALRAWTGALRACSGCAWRAKAELRARQLRQRCELELVVTSEPSGLDLELDGRSFGRTPSRERLLPGIYQLRIRPPSGRWREERVELREGSGRTTKSFSFTTLDERFEGHADRPPREREEPAAASGFWARLTPLKRVTLISSVAFSLATVVTGIAFIQQQETIANADDAQTLQLAQESQQIWGGVTLGLAALSGLSLTYTFW